MPAGQIPIGNCFALVGMLALHLRSSGGNMDLTAVFKKVPEGYIAWVEGFARRQHPRRNSGRNPRKPARGHPPGI